MAFALRIWKLAGGQSICRHCRQPIRWVTDVQGKSQKFQRDAKSIRQEPKDERGLVVEIYDRDAFHVCPKRKAPTVPREARP